MLDFNTVGEVQIVASDGVNLVVFPLETQGMIKRRLREIERRGLKFLAIAFVNFSIEYLYSWRETLGYSSWLGIQLEMRRKKSREYKNKFSAILVPAKERYYPLADFDALKPFLMLGGA